MLWNIVDKRNTTHLKLLKFLGFKFLREVSYGPNNLTFIEFCRVRTSNSNTAVAGVASAVGRVICKLLNKKLLQRKDWNTKMQIRKINHEWDRSRAEY